MLMHIYARHEWKQQTLNREAGIPPRNTCGEKNNANHKSKQGCLGNGYFKHYPNGNKAKEQKPDKQQRTGRKQKRQGNWCRTPRYNKSVIFGNESYRGPPAAKE
jgi:hypothetical protein